VAAYDSLVPVRADHDCKPSDLMMIGRPRSEDTDSVKWPDLGRSIEIKRMKEEREGLTVGLGFR
jgi:hypothetical protein